MFTFILDKNQFNLNENEIVGLKQVNSYFKTHDFFYVLHELHIVFYSNILRRIEYFDKDYFILLLNKKEHLKENSNIIKRWENFDILDILNLAKKLKIINYLSYHLFLSFHEYKVHTLITDIVNKDYLISYFEILKNELLKSELMQNQLSKDSLKRRKSDLEIQKRRKSDLEIQKRRKSDLDNLKRRSNDANNDQIIYNTKNINPNILTKKIDSFLLDDAQEDDSKSLYV